MSGEALIIVCVNCTEQSAVIPPCECLKIISPIIISKKGTHVKSLSAYEQETVINFNAGEKHACLYTRDQRVMRELDDLVYRFPKVYHLDSQSDTNKTYSFPKFCVSYRKPRMLTEEQREKARERMKQLNMSK